MSMSLPPHCGTRTQNCSGEWGAQSPLLQLTPPQPCAQTRRAPGPRALCAPGWGGWGTRWAPPKGLGVAEEGFAPPEEPCSLPSGALLAPAVSPAPCARPRLRRGVGAPCPRVAPRPSRPPAGLLHGGEASPSPASSSPDVSGSSKISRWELWAREHCTPACSVPRFPPEHTPGQRPQGDAGGTDCTHGTRGCAKSGVAPPAAAAQHHSGPRGTQDLAFSFASCKLSKPRGVPCALHKRPVG